MTRIPTPLTLDGRPARDPADILPPLPRLSDLDWRIVWNAPAERRRYLIARGAVESVVAREQQGAA